VTVGADLSDPLRESSNCCSCDCSCPGLEASAVKDDAIGLMQPRMWAANK